MHPVPKLRDGGPPLPRRIFRAFLFVGALLAAPPGNAILPNGAFLISLLRGPPRPVPSFDLPKNIQVRFLHPGPEGLGTGTQLDKPPCTAWCGAPPARAPRAFLWFVYWVLNVWPAKGNVGVPIRIKLIIIRNKNPSISIITGIIRLTSHQTFLSITHVF